MHKSITRVAAIAIGSMLLAGSGTVSAAHKGRSQARPPATMTFAALEQRAIAMGIRPTELKIKYRTAEIEGRDANGRKVEIKLDPGTGAVLEREFDRRSRDHK